MRIDPLAGSTADFVRPKGPHLLDRLLPLHEWVESRKASGHWQYLRTLTTGPTPNANLVDVNNCSYEGVNFAVQDYLGLSTHPAIVEAANSVAKDFGVHSAGSAGLAGNSRLSEELKAVIGDFLGYRYVKLFPTGWAAAFGTIYGLIRQHDFIVMDQLAHASLQVGAIASTNNIVRFRHRNLDDLSQKLQAIRSENPEAGILVVIESLYSMDSDVADIRATQDIAHNFGAILMLDVAHDLGNLGPRGTGFLGEQDMLGKVDIVMGSFSKTFASNGGFIATNHPAVDNYFSWFSSPWTFSNALSPIQCAIVKKAFEIIKSDEGEELRAKLMKAVLELRERLTEHQLTVLGEPSAIVPVVVGKPPVIRTASRLLPEIGVFANMVEFPVVPLPTARFRMQVMATHSTEDVQRGADGVARAIQEAETLLANQQQ